MTYKSIEVPWTIKGNLRGLTDRQLYEDSGLFDFFITFRHCFIYNYEECIYWFFNNGDI